MKFDTPDNMHNIYISMIMSHFKLLQLHLKISNLITIVDLESLTRGFRLDFLSGLNPKY